MKPVNRNATANACALLEYLYDVAGKKIIAGQHTQTREQEELSYIYDKTQRYPKLIGYELLSYSPNINFNDASKECLDEVYDNQGTLKTALERAQNNNDIITFTFHWFSPLYGRDKSFYAKNTDFDPAAVLIQGTKEQNAFYHDLDVIAQELHPFLEKDIPILWRPFHESDGEWFWWGRKGADIAKQLYLLMYDHFVNYHHLNNLLWVWNALDAYPGDDYVDVVSIDVYLEKYKETDYKDEYLKLISKTSQNKVAALGEVGYLPDINIWNETKIPWAYFMSWSKEFIIGEQYNKTDKLIELYQNENVITEL